MALAPLSLEDVELAAGASGGPHEFVRHMTGSMTPEIPANTCLQLLSTKPNAYQMDARTLYDSMYVFLIGRRIAKPRGQLAHIENKSQGPAGGPCPFSRAYFDHMVWLIPLPSQPLLVPLFVLMGMSRWLLRSMVNRPSNKKERL